MSDNLKAGLNQFADDIVWLHTHYDELIKKYNEEFVAIKNHNVVINDKDLNEFERKLREKDIDVSDHVIEFIKSKRNELTIAHRM